MRPKNFTEVLGNDSIVAAVQKQLKERVPIAWMFSGPPGVGKTTLALLVAESIEAKEVIELNAADTNGVDSIRELVQSCQYNPLSGKYRVVILDEAQQLTSQAQQVLLKPTEDKDSTTVFIFCTTDPQKILEALRKRCVSFVLKGISGDERGALVDRALKASGSDRRWDAILHSVEQADITSPRDVIMAVERYTAGLSADDAVQATDSDPVLAEIAKATLTGKWAKVAPLLKGLKAADVKGLRQVLSAFLRNGLLNDTGYNKSADALKKLALYSSYEAGVDLGAVVGIIYDYCN